MNKRIELYQMLGGMGTALVVMSITCIVLWGKPLFFEAMVWQLLILVSVFFITNKFTSDEIGRLALITFLPLVYLLCWRVPIDIFFIYTIIFAACAPFYFNIKACWILLLVINILWYLMRLAVLEDTNPLIQTLLVGTFHVFAQLSAMAAKEAQESNEQTLKLNRELLATQHLLNDATRENERTRIARDLHDLLGHHLTALTINLQVASHLTSGEAKDKVDQCHALSKLLLNDVRDAVSTLRDIPTVNLHELLEITLKDIPRLTISLQVPSSIHIEDVNIAEAILRLVQESITNTLKHSKAKKVTITAGVKDTKLLINIQDDGAGSKLLTLGNGLKGMQERFANLGGVVEFNSEQSFSISAEAPYLK